jgi:hypothetical protein
MLGDGRDAGQQVGRGHVVLVVLASEMLGRQAGILHFVIALGSEADRVGGCRLAGDLAEHAGDRRAIGAPREEAPTRWWPTISSLTPSRISLRKASRDAGEGLPVVLVETQRPVANFVHTLAVDEQRVGAGSRRTPLKIVRGAGIMWKYR